MYQRLLQLPKRRSALILGPRQTGKTTFVRSLLPAEAWSVDLLQHDAFLRYSKDPALFRRAVLAQRSRSRARVASQVQTSRACAPWPLNTRTSRASS